MSSARFAVTMLSMMLLGCESTGLSYREAGSQNVSNYLLALNDEAMKGTPPARPAKPALPIRLAVAQVGAVAPANAFMAPLQAEPALFAQLDAIPAATAPIQPYRSARHDQPYSPQDDARAQMGLLCRTAEQIGAGYLFLYGGNIDHATVKNELSVLNLTVIGAFVVPSREVRGEGKASGALIDLKSRQIVFLLSAAAKDRRTSAAVTDQAAELTVLENMRDQLSSELAHELVKRLQENPVALEHAPQ